MALTYRVLFVEEPMTAMHLREPQIEVTPRVLPNGAQINVARLLVPAAHDEWIGHGDPRTQPIYQALLNEYLKANRYQQPILWLYTPMAHDFTSIPHRLLVVDVMDQLSAFKGAPHDLVDYEAQLLPKADVVFAGGTSLFHDKKLFNQHTYCFPSGVEIEHFARAANRDAFAPPAPLDTLSAPIIGYFGVIDERMDMELIRTMAQRHPEWNIVLLGPVVKIDAAELPQAFNLHYPGMRSYADLPAYLAHFDVALIPFALNKSTRYLSPTKTLEYMAAHKPVVSTAIEDVRALYGEVVQIGSTHDEFIVHVEQSLKCSSPDRLAKERALLVQHSWDNIVAGMLVLLEPRPVQLPRRVPAPIQTTAVKVS